MDSCFPPLANLSLRGSSRGNKPNKNRHSTDASNNSQLFYQNTDNIRNQTEIMPKLEVLQDLDLYYIRQIASSLKVNFHYTLFFLSFLFPIFQPKFVQLRVTSYHLGRFFAVAVFFLLCETIQSF